MQRRRIARGNIAKPGHCDESIALGLFKQVFDFRSPQTCIDGDEDRSDLRQRKLQHNPFGNIGSPQSYAVTRFDAKGKQAFGDFASEPFKLAEIVSKPAVRINQRFVLRIVSGQHREQFADANVPVRARSIASLGSRHFASSKKQQVNPRRASQRSFFTGIIVLRQRAKVSQPCVDIANFELFAVLRAWSRFKQTLDLVSEFPRPNDCSPPGSHEEGEMTV